MFLPACQMIFRFLVILWAPQRTPPSPADAMAGSVSAVGSASPGGAATAGEAPPAARTPARARAKRLKRLKDDEKAALASHFLATRWVASRPSVDAAALEHAARLPRRAHGASGWGI